jgi:hypothetical protein
MIDFAKLEAAYVDIGHRCAVKLSSADRPIRFTGVKIGNMFDGGHPRICTLLHFEDPVLGRFNCANFTDIELFDNCGHMPGDACESSLQETCESLLFGDKAIPSSAK